MMSVCSDCLFFSVSVLMTGIVTCCIHHCAGQCQAPIPSLNSMPRTGRQIEAHSLFDFKLLFIAILSGSFRPIFLVGDIQNIKEKHKDRNPDN